MIVELQDQRDLPRELGRPGFEEPERGRVGAAAGLDRQLEVIERVVARGVRGKAPRRAMLEALIHRQDHQPPGASERPRVQHTRQVRARTRVIAPVPAQDFLHPLRHRARLRSWI